MRVSTRTNERENMTMPEAGTAEENCWTVKGTGDEEDRGGDKQPLQPSKVNKERKQHRTWNKQGGWLGCSWWLEVARNKVVFSPVHQRRSLKT